MLASYVANKKGSSDLSEEKHINKYTENKRLTKYRNKLTITHIIDRPAKKYPVTVPLLDRNIACKEEFHE